MSSHICCDLMHLSSEFCHLWLSVWTRRRNMRLRNRFCRVLVQEKLFLSSLAFYSHNYVVNFRSLFKWKWFSMWVSDNNGLSCWVLNQTWASRYLKLSYLLCKIVVLLHNVLLYVQFEEQLKYLTKKIRIEWFYLIILSHCVTKASNDWSWSVVVGMSLQRPEGNMAAVWHLKLNFHDLRWVLVLLGLHHHLLILFILMPLVLCMY